MSCLFVYMGNELYFITMLFHSLVQTMKLVIVLASGPHVTLASNIPFHIRKSDLALRKTFFNLCKAMLHE